MGPDALRVEDFGTTSDGRTVRRLEVGRPPGPVLHLLDLGATVHRLEVTCGDGVRRNVVLGHPSPEDHLASSDYLGATIGRYANRIATGRFLLEGAWVQVGVHDRGNHLHGGPDGFDRRTWTVVEHGQCHAVLALISPDGDQGFPGNLEARVAFRVTPTGVRLDLRATTDRVTPVNLTNHAYFNLDGEGSGTVDLHELEVLADRFTPVDATGIPLGDHAPVAGTALDFRAPTPIGRAVREGDPQVGRAGGVDHNFVLRGSGFRPAATLTSPATRTRLRVSTDQPGLQVYTGNCLDGTRPSTAGGVHRERSGIALEPQLFPDSPNHPAYPSAFLHPGEIYRASIGWTFDSGTDRDERN